MVPRKRPRWPLSGFSLVLRLIYDSKVYCVSLLAFFTSRIFISHEKICAIGCGQSENAIFLCLREQNIDIQNWTADGSGGDRDTCGVRGKYELLSLSTKA